MKFLEKKHLLNPFTSSIILEQVGHAQIRSETIRLLQNAAFLIRVCFISPLGEKIIIEIG